MSVIYFIFQQTMLFTIPLMIVAPVSYTHLTLPTIA